jgi:uncharacterized membrane protein required for colicin V production
MKQTPSVLLVLAPFVLAGRHGAIMGNLLVLGITVGIFVATLSLGRVTNASRSTTSSNAETSTSSQG